MPALPEVFNGIDLSGAKILMIDDEKLFGDMMSLLMKTFGATTTVTYSAPDGLVAIYRELFDVILLDFQMPRMTGFEFMKTLRLHPDPQVNKTFVIAITTQVGSRQQILDSGCDMYFSKPIDTPAFLRTLTDVVKKVKATAN